MKKNFGSLIFVLVFALASSSCPGALESGEEKCDNYRKAMRDFVIKISDEAHKSNADFIIIPQNGQAVAWDDDENIVPDEKYFAAIDGTGREDVFYGTDKNWGLADGASTPSEISNEFQKLCDVYRDAGVCVLSIDYTGHDAQKIKDSYELNKNKGYISFSASERNLNAIPLEEPYAKKSSDIKRLSDAKNFLYIINPEKFKNKNDFVNSLSKTDYDVLIIDLFCESGDDDSEGMLSKEDVACLKTKANGGSRLVICYMSIGEAENYRWYWQKGWRPHHPSFLERANRDWAGNYKVRYWYKEWQEIICGEKNSYLSKILDAGFDGVYLDIIDAYEYFE